jgi:signal transduction histidine kinase
MGEPSLDRRRGRGRRRTDAQDTLAVRGLLHDLGHQMTTLSYLVEAVRGNTDLPGDAEQRLDLLSLEMTRLLDVIAEEIPGRQAGAAAVGQVDLRALAGQVAQLAQVAHGTAVRLRPGAPASIQASPAVLWRVLTNVVDNAARAAGPDGHVDLAVSLPPGQAWAVIDVTDDGPGFGHGPPGLASLGLSVVTALLESCGGRMEARTADSGGAWVSILLPACPPGPAPPGPAPGGPGNIP